MSIKLIFALFTICVCGATADKNGKFYGYAETLVNSDVNNKKDTSKPDWLVSRFATLESYLLNEVNDLKDEMVTILKMGSNVTALNMQLDAVRWNLQEISRSLVSLKGNSVPIGFVYVQLPHEKDPSQIWSGMTWKEVKDDEKYYDAIEFRYKALKIWKRVM